MDCSPEALSDSAAELQGASFKALLAFQAASLAAGQSPSDLAEASKCLACYSKKQLLAMWFATLCGV